MTNQTFFLYFASGNGKEQFIDFQTWLNHLTVFPVVIRGRCANSRACKLFLNLQLNASDSSFGGNVSTPRLFFILLAHGKVITNIAQDTQADFWLVHVQEN